MTKADRRILAPEIQAQSELIVCLKKLLGEARTILADYAPDDESNIVRPLIERIDKAREKP